MIKLEIHPHFSATPAVTDTRIDEWKRGTRLTIERPGVPPPNGLSAVRKIQGGPLRLQEEVVRWKEPHAIDYRLISGFQLRDHLGEFRFLQTPEGGSAAPVSNPPLVSWYAGGSLVGNLFGEQFERAIGNAMQSLGRELRSES